MLLKIFNSKYFLLGCIFVIFVCCSYIGGYSVASIKYELKISKIKEDSEKSYAVALEKKAKKQAEISDAFSKSQGDLVSNLERTSAYYDSLISVDLRIPDEWVQSNNTSGENGSLPDNSSTSRAVQRASCKCACDNGTKLQKLYKQQLTVAKDCDITTSYYNSLLKLYESVRHAQN